MSIICDHRKTKMKAVFQYSNHSKYPRVVLFDIKYIECCADCGCAVDGWFFGFCKITQ